MGSFLLLKGLYIWAFFFHCCSLEIAKSSKTLKPKSNEGTVHVHGEAAIARTRPNFVCATIDLWPASKCEKICSWGNSSFLNLDLNNEMLLEAVRALAPLKLRLGGSLQNKLTYETEDHKPKHCHGFVKKKSELFGFTDGCLSLGRWDDLNKALVIFGLNALTGRSIVQGAANGPWNKTNAASFIKYTYKKGYQISAWEFGNELSGEGIGARVSVDQYANDTHLLKNVLKNIYTNVTTRPLLLAPGGFYEKWWFQRFIEKTNKSNPVDVISHHIYNLGSGSDKDLVDKILNATHLNKRIRMFKELRDMLKSSSSETEAWVTESGGASNSGAYNITNTFVSSFWYLDQLGMASAYDTKTYCRQTLIGGNYGLLDTKSYKPNPDYYSALLWCRLMGNTVLNTSLNGLDNLRAYAHCAKNSTGITLLLINLDRKNTVRVKVSCSTSPNSPCHDVRDEYHLTTKDGNIRSRTMLLNGKALEVDKSGRIPRFSPQSVNSSDLITVDNLSFAFIHLKTAYARPCRH